MENEQALKEMIRKEVVEILDERERHSGVLVEEKHDDMTRVLEAIGGVEKTINSHYQEFREFRNEANFKFDFLIGEYKHLRKGQDALFEENQIFFDEFKSMRIEFKNEMKDMREEFRDEMKDMREEFSGRFDRIDSRLDKLEK
jgi:hypothetical protein